MMQMMKEAKLKKLKELKKMLQKKMFDAVEVDDQDSLVSDMTEISSDDMYKEKGDDYAMQGIEEGVEGDEEGLDEELLEKMIESMRGKRPKSEHMTDFRVMPPKPSIMISVSTSKPMGKKGKRRKA